MVKQLDIRLLRETNTYSCPGEISAKFGSNLDRAVVYYCQLLLVARGRSVEKTAPDSQPDEARELEEIAAKQKYNGSENEEGAVRRLFFCRAEGFCQGKAATDHRPARFAEIDGA